MRPPWPRGSRAARRVSATGPALAALGKPLLIRSPRFRLRLANQLPPVIPRELLTQLVPDLAVLPRVLIRFAQADHVTGSRQLHVVYALDPARAAGHYHHPVPH